MPLGSRNSSRAPSAQLPLLGSDDWQSGRTSSPVPKSKLMFVLKPPKDVTFRMHAEATRHVQAESECPAYPADLLHMSLLCVSAFDAPPKSMIAKARAAAASIEARPIPITLDNSGFFGGRRHLALYRNAGNLMVVQFAEMLRTVLRRHNLPCFEAAKSTPHVTLSYDSVNTEPMPIERNYAWIAGEFMLIYSHHGETRHEEFGRWSLDPKAAPYPRPAEQFRMAV
jgi:2'-5' RNA ligase